jgi:hypothetical protein
MNMMDFTQQVWMERERDRPTDRDKQKVASFVSVHLVLGVVIRDASENLSC